MKWKATWVLGLLLTSSAALAQTDTLVGIRKGSIELGAAGGLSCPVGDYGDLAARSGTGGVIVGYYASPKLSFGADWGGHWHPGTDHIDSLLGLQAHFPVYRVLTPYIKYQFQVARVSPYVTGLTGLYLQETRFSKSDLGVTTWTETVTQGYVGLALGGGVQMVSDDNVVVFVDARFHNAMRSDSSPIQFIDLRVGFSFLL